MHWIWVTEKEQKDDLLGRGIAITMIALFVQVIKIVHYAH